MARCLHDGDQQSALWLVTTLTTCGRSAGYLAPHTVRPRWRLLQQSGPGWYSVAEREERLFTNRSNQPGDDMKDEVRTGLACVENLVDD